MPNETITRKAYLCPVHGETFDWGVECRMAGEPKWDRNFCTKCLIVAMDACGIRSMTAQPTEKAE